MSRAACPARRWRWAGSSSSVPSNLPARIAPATTVLYAKNLMNFVQLLVDPKTQELKIDTGDELIKGTLLTMGGAVVHDAFKPAA